MKVTVRVDGQAFTVDIADAHARPIVATIDGERFEVWPEDVAPGGSNAVPPSVPSAAQPAPRAAATAAPTPVEAVSGAVRAPLPGVILSVAVHPGDHVGKGDTLCVLEAMKMRNPIHAACSGTIARVHISVGQRVGHGDLLMELGD